MITYLEGTVIGLGDNRLDVQLNGIGFGVGVPAPLAASVQVGQTVALFTHLIVREDLLALYGFQSAAERDFFLLLLGVNGIGPKLALSILSVLSMDAIRRAVLSEQAEIFSRVPGVGKRNAQKILISLQGKVTAEGVEDAISLDQDNAVLDALTALGYSVVEAQAAIQSIPKDTPEDVETRLRAALRFFSV